MRSRYQKTRRSSPPTSGKLSPDASDTPLGKLFRFYSECVDAEDRQSLSFKLSGINKSFISPWVDGASEPLLTTATVQCQITPKSHAAFLQKGRLETGNAVNLFYGYPVVIDADDFLTPVFFISVESVETQSGEFRLRVPDPSAVMLNHHLFRKARFSVEELQDIQQQLEDEYGSFAARLRDAAELLGVVDPLHESEGFEPLPRAGESTDRWINRGVLFRSERSMYTASLRRELEALTKYERLQQSIPTTALGALLRLNSDTATSWARASPVCQILPLNDAQVSAARAALGDRITVVTGPPGTGKSQVIIDVLATCARDGRSVLFASKNNKAVDVVSERLATLLGADDWTLRLGSAEYVEKARESLRSRLAAAMPEREPLSGRTVQDITVLVEQLDRRRAEVSKHVDAYHAAADERARLSSLISIEWHESTPLEIASARELHRRVYFDSLALAGKEPLSLWLRIERLFAPQRQRRRLTAQASQVANALGPEFTVPPEAGDSLDGLVSYLARIKFYLDWRAAVELEQRLQSQVENLEPIAALEADLRQARQALSEASINELALAWTSRVGKNAALLSGDIAHYFMANQALRTGQARGGGFITILDDAVASFTALAKALPVWIVTTLSTRRGVPLSPALFDLVVIDEASQCDIASAIPLLYRAKSALIIGDPKQLRHISTLEPAMELKLADGFGTRKYWDTGWRYADVSLYELAAMVENGRNRKAHFLREHYRSDASIIEFSNRVFYNGQLVVRTDRQRLAASGFETGVFWHDIRGSVPPGSRSAYNPDEIAEIVGLIRTWTPVLQRNPKTTVGIVTPFRRQMEGIETAILHADLPKEVTDRVKVGTAHRFQGDECDIIIFSPVVAEGMPPRLVRWVSRTDQLLNVAITRARAALHVVGDLTAARVHGGRLGDLAAHIVDFQPSHAEPETPEERRIASLLTAVGLHYRSQVKLGRYRIDFEVVSPFGNRWAVEIDGAQHYEGGAIDLDESRDLFLRENGYRVVRISNKDVRDSPDRVRSHLQRLY